MTEAVSRITRVDGDSHDQERATQDELADLNKIVKALINEHGARHAFSKNVSGYNILDVSREAIPEDTLSDLSLSNGDIYFGVNTDTKTGESNIIFRQILRPIDFPGYHLTMITYDLSGEGSKTVQFRTSTSALPVEASNPQKFEKKDFISKTAVTQLKLALTDSGLQPKPPRRQ